MGNIMKLYMLAVLIGLSCAYVLDTNHDNVPSVGQGQLQVIRQMVTATEGQRVTITCPAYYRILIKQTMYADRVNGPSTCSDPNANAKLAQVCDQMQTCVFVPDNNLFDSDCDKTRVRHAFVSHYFCAKDLCLTYSTFCDNGGSCLLNPVGAPYCACRPGFGGMNCEFAENPCRVDTCKNGGTCVPDWTYQPICICKGDWTGSDCSVSPCESNDPCIRGECSVNPETDRAQCKCDEDYFGPYCSENACKDEPCKNGGLCLTDATFNHICMCKGEWSGDDCTVSPCDVNPCMEGTCEVDTVTGLAKCKCLENYYGYYCTVSANNIC